MAEMDDARGFSVYLEGHEGHQGNVLAHSFLAKIHRLILVLNKLERAYITAPTRQTDFEITAASKQNPTMLTLKAVPRVESYNPAPALGWSIRQLAAVGRGDEPDNRVRGEIADDLIKLATKESEHGYKAFWINGHADAVVFDERFRANAFNLARERRGQDAPQRWRTGTAIGAVVGELLKVDDLDAENEFIVVPPVGAGAIRCTFPVAMREEMGRFLFKTVQVHGVLHYGQESPFPYLVEAKTGGINLYPATTSTRSLSEMRGLFAGRERPQRPDWDAFLNGA